MRRRLEKKLLSAVTLTILAFALVLTGCGNGTNNEQSSSSPSNPATTAPAEATAETSPSPSEQTASGTVTLAGSTSVQPLAEELGNAFMAVNKDARIEVSGGGSGAGIKAAQGGTADIGMASRALKDDETGIKPVVIATDGIAVVVNKDNAAADLTTEQVKDIFSGKLTNWKDAGGKDANIVVINREEGSGTRDAFKELVLGKDGEFVAQAIIQNSTGAVREAVGQDVNAIGFISFGGMNDSVKALHINGIEPSEDNIKQGTYPISRPFNFLIHESTAPSAVAQAFIDFVLSPEGQAVVTDNGYVTVK